MQTVLTYFIIFFTGLFVQAQNNLEITITNFGSNEGTALVALYNSEATFLSKRYKGTLSKISDEKITVLISDIPDGTYAVSAFHDENDNQKFDMLLGMFPKEDYATSNDAKGNFGPPKWEDAKFEIKGGVIENITLKMN